MAIYAIHYLVESELYVKLEGSCIFSIKKLLFPSILVNSLFNVTFFYQFQ